MLAGASIIAQPIESQGNKKSLSTTMQGNYAGFAESVVVIADVYARQAHASSRHAGLVSAWSHREGPPGAPGRRVWLDRRRRLLVRGPLAEAWNRRLPGQNAI
jgi:hypothetical protein